MVTAESLGLNDVQFAWASKIVARIKSRNFPEDQGQRCADIALATCLVESGLKMYANGNNTASLKLPHDAVGWDHGSVGLYQQQVGGAKNSTANWGTTSQCMDVNYSTDKFVNSLRTKRNGAWLTMTNGAAAQMVQGSAFPDRYADQDSKAIKIRKALWGGTAAPVVAHPANPTPAKPVVAPPKVSKPAAGTVYTVTPSDSDGLIALCARHGISNWKAVAIANGIAAPDYTIRVGEKITFGTGAVSGGAKAPKPATKARHIVVQGDTLTAIAKGWNVSVTALKKANPKAGHPAGNFDTIWPGDTLIHP